MISKIKLFHHTSSPPLIPLLNHPDTCGEVMETRRRKRANAGAYFYLLTSSRGFHTVLRTTVSFPFAAARWQGNHDPAAPSDHQTCEPRRGAPISPVLLPYAAMLDLAAQYFTERFSRNEHFPAFPFISSFGRGGASPYLLLLE